VDHPPQFPAKQVNANHKGRDDREGDEDENRGARGHGGTSLSGAAWTAP